MLHILLFLKAPRAGFVKTRLAEQIGKEQALAAYLALVERQFTVLPKEETTEIHYTPTDAESDLKSWLGSNVSYFPQVESELGIRLQSAVSDAFKRGANSVICIGGDCPKLNCIHFEHTSNLLGQGNDLVVGPSEDGGYYLIGMKQPIPGIFEDIPWSSTDTLKATLEKAESLGLRTSLLETLYDVDQASELDRAINEGHISL